MQTRYYYTVAASSRHGITANLPKFKWDSEESGYIEIKNKKLFQALAAPQKAPTLVKNMSDLGQGSSWDGMVVTHDGNTQPTRLASGPQAMPQWH